MPRIRKTPEEVSASRRAAVRVLWDRMSPEERSQFSRDRWASVDPERRRELMQSMRAKRIPKPVYRPLSKRKVKPTVEVKPAVSVAQVVPVPLPAIVTPVVPPMSKVITLVPKKELPVPDCDCGRPVREDSSYGWACTGCGFHPLDCGCHPIVPAVVPVVPEIDYEAIVQGRWYSRIAAAHQDTARANAREWQCACGACRMARMEAQ
jgi:hypothetical protein